MMKTSLAILILGLTSCSAWADLSVFAAASTTDVMRELAALFEKTGGEKIRFNFASSGTLARQIEAGAPADVFVSANTRWMDYLEKEKLLVAGTRTNVACNSLVLIVPIDSSLTCSGFPTNIKGKLAVGDFQSVPAGTYAESALKSMGWLDDVRGKLVKGSNVRMVLMYVERGEVDEGIVYLTDAKQSDKVKVIGGFPPGSYPPIVYPAAACSANKAAARFLEFLNSPEAKRIFKTYGFSMPSD